MTTTAEAQEKVSAASNACDEVHAAIREAYRQLDGDFSINGYGVYHDRHHVRDRIILARARLDEALAKLDKIDWPTNAEYDRL